MEPLGTNDVSSYADLMDDDMDRAAQQPIPIRPPQQKKRKR